MDVALLYIVYKPRDVMDWLKLHYDKLLHVTVTFTLMAFCLKWLSVSYSFLIMATLQGGKAWLNYRIKIGYKIWGDMAANAFGYLLVLLYVIL